MGSEMCIRDSCGCIFGARSQGLDLEDIRKDAEAFLADKEGR